MTIQINESSANKTQSNPDIKPAVQVAPSKTPSNPEQNLNTISSGGDNAAKSGGMQGEGALAKSNSDVNQSSSAV